MKKQQKRATFEDVCSAQDVLDDLIEQAIKKDGPLSDKNKKKFKTNFRLATLGLSSEYRFLLRGNNGTYDMGHVGHAFRWLVKRTKNPIVFDNGEDKIKLKDCWIQLWDYLDKIYDPALETSIKISKEQNIYGGNAEATSYDEVRKK